MSSIILPAHPLDRGDSQGFMTRAGALYLGPDLGTSIHAIHNYKIYIATHGDFDLLLAGGRRVNSCRAVVIAPDRPHRIISRGVMLGVFYLVPETVEGRGVSATFSGQEAFLPPARALAAVTPVLRRHVEGGCSGSEAEEVSQSLFSKMAPPSSRVAPPDERVVHTLKYLDAAPSRRVTIAEVASEIALSQSRIEHLFKEQVGIPITRYMLWARVRNALRMMAASKSLTQVALASGFSDLAHLSRTFRRMIGLPPSMLLRHIQLRLSTPEEPYPTRAKACPCAGRCLTCCARAAGEWAVLQQ